MKEKIKQATNIDNFFRLIFSGPWLYIWKTDAQVFAKTANVFPCKTGPDRFANACVFNSQILIPIYLQIIFQLF